MIIGVLALQGSFQEHYQSLLNLQKQRNDFEVILVKTVDDINKIDGLVIPGGESTTLRKIIMDFDLYYPIKWRIEEGLTVYGTCAGLIILANMIDNKSGFFRAIDINVRRNAYGRQNSSFVIHQNVEEFGSQDVEMVFIRAPYISMVGHDVQIISTYDGEVTCCRNKNVLVSSYHPEFTTDLTIHNYFLDMVKTNISEKAN